MQRVIGSQTLNLIPTIGSVIREWKDCRLCPISEFVHKKAFLETIPPRQSVVDILMIGEGPGKGEDALGRPFVGASGAFLRDVFIDAGLYTGDDDCDDTSPNDRPPTALPPEKVAPQENLKSDLVIGLDNLIACRPTDRMGGPNRQPHVNEIDECKPRLLQIVEVIEPIAILCLGAIPQANVPGILGDARWNGLVWHIKHPSAVLRHGGKSAPYYNDYVREFRKLFTVVRQLKESMFQRSV